MAPDWRWIGDDDEDGEENESIAGKTRDRSDTKATGVAGRRVSHILEAASGFSNTGSAMFFSCRVFHETRRQHHSQHADCTAAA